MSLNTDYTLFQAKAASYTLTVADDVVKFTTAAGGVVATLPLAKTCTQASGQDVKVIVSASTSTDPLTIAVQSGDTLIGEMASGPAQTIAANETAYLTSNHVNIWYVSGGTATSGVSGFSGFSGASGYSGFSGFSGYSGFSGVSGYSGYSGVSGYSGFSGKSGYSGFSGYSGYSGFSGFSGKSGYSGFSVFP